MIVKDFADQLFYLLANKIINPEDEVLIIGSGNKKSGDIQSICLPIITKIDNKIKDNSKGYYNIGIYRKEKNK